MTEGAKAQQNEIKPQDNKALWVTALAKAVSFPTPFGALLNELYDIRSFSSRKRAEKKRTIAEEKAKLVKELIESGIDPAAFDVLISNEINRKLKVQFGIAFLVLTFLFTAASYSIVIFDGVKQWNISEVAITALIIETPIQFIGLLYIIARNLFPHRINENDTGEDS